METTSPVSVEWEHVDSLVDHRIDARHNHVWPFQGSFPVDVRFLILDRRHEVPRHRPDHLEVVICESGELGYEVENESCVLSKDDVIIVGNQIHHRCVQLSPAQTQLRTIVLSFLPQSVHLGTPLGDDLQYLMPFHMQAPSVSNVIRANRTLSGELRDLIDKIRMALPGDSNLSQLAIRTYLKVVLLSVVNHYAGDREGRLAFQRQREAAARMAAVFEYVENHYDEPIRVSEVGRICATSTSRFMSLFKEATGQSFVVYLNRFRVAKAKGLLLHSGKSIAEISMETGFCNQSYFGAVFRRVTGETPLNFRQQATAGDAVTPLKWQ